MAGSAGATVKGDPGGGNWCGAPETDVMVTRSPLSMVNTGLSAASK